MGRELPPSRVADWFVLDFPPLHRKSLKGEWPACPALTRTLKGTTSITTTSKLANHDLGPQSFDVPQKLTLCLQSKVGEDFTYTRTTIICLVRHVHPLALAIRLDWIACQPDPLKYPLFPRIFMENKKQDFFRTI